MPALQLLYMTTMVNIRMTPEEIAFLDTNFKSRSEGIRTALRLAMGPPDLPHAPHPGFVPQAPGEPLAFIEDVSCETIHKPTVTDLREKISGLSAPVVASPRRHHPACKCPICQPVKEGK